jgi:hypothetical protein
MESQATTTLEEPLKQDVKARIRFSTRHKDIELPGGPVPLLLSTCKLKQLSQMIEDVP